MSTFIFHLKKNKRTYFTGLFGLIIITGMLFHGNEIKAASTTFAVNIVPFGVGPGWHTDQSVPIYFLANLDMGSYAPGSTITANGGVSSFPYRDSTPALGDVTFNYQLINETVALNGVTKTIYRKTANTQGAGVETFTPGTFTAPSTPGTYTAQFNVTSLNTNVSASPRTGSASVTYTVVASDPSVNLVATPSTVASGGTTVLTWTSANTTGNCVSSGGNWVAGNRPRNNTTGVTTPALTTSQTYTLTCHNSAGVEASDSVTVSVNATNASCGTAAKNYLGTDTEYSGTPCSSGTGTLPTLFPSIGGSKTWTCTGFGGGNPATCTATRSTISCGGSVPANATAYGGTNLTGLTVATNYTYADPNTAAKCEYSCNTGYGWNSSSCVAAPTVNLVATPSTVASGGASSLTWTSANTVGTCTSSGDWAANTNRPRNNSTGLSTGAITENKTYTLTCHNSAGVSASDSVTVSVLYNGTCDTTTVNQCTHGTLLDIVDSLTEYRWMCLGTVGG